MPLNSANHNSKQCLVDCRTKEYINKNFWRTRTSALNALHSLLVVFKKPMIMIQRTSPSIITLNILISDCQILQYIPKLYKKRGKILRLILFVDCKIYPIGLIDPAIFHLNTN